MSADHFSSVAGDYAKFRPCYPEALFQWLATQVSAQAHVWDVGCGSGQASVALARYFTHVYASDISATQIAQATPAHNIQYVVRGSENSGLAANSMSLVTIAQALHWFDLARFYEEVERVMKKSGLIVAWTYSPIQLVDAKLNVLMQDHYQNIAQSWWPPGREHVDNGYRNLAFPFEPIATPTLFMTASMSVDELCGYVRTWSASARYYESTQKDPTLDLRQQLLALVGEGYFDVRWDLNIRAGRL